MSSILDKILTLTRQLYPKGRAFKMPFGGDLEKLHKGLRISENRAYLDAVSILDALIPDNDNFTADDATDWERRLGMITNPLVSLDDRKLAIKRKMNFPGNVPARQASTWLENQLRAAGFDVYVYENIPAVPPEDIATGDFMDDFDHGYLEHGAFDHGGGFNNLVANNIVSDFGFDVGENLKCTFFIGGTPLGQYADVDANRLMEFRQLILRTKPVQTVAFLFVNYV